MSSSIEVDKFSVMVIAGPVIDKVGEVLADNFIQLLRPSCNEIYLITGNFFRKYDEKVYIVQIEKNENFNSNRPFFLVRAINILLTQAKITFHLVKLSKKYDMVFFHIGGEYWNILPLLCLKIIKKKISFYHLGGNKAFQESINEVSKWYKFCVSILSKTILTFSYYLADQIICEAESVIEFSGLEKYRKKIFVIGGRYLDTNLFKVKTRYGGREDIVGYIGNFRPVKGIIEFVRAIPLVLKELSNVRFLIVGEGYLEKQVRDEIERIGVKDKVTLTGWVRHEQLPSILNTLKLLVVPSYSEGVPGVIQEAMACGTIVAATPVGGIPDLIKDNKTGFIIQNNTPLSISRTIKKVFNNNNLDEIGRKARVFINRQYSYNVMSKRYNQLIHALKDC